MKSGLMNCLLLRRGKTWVPRENMHSSHVCGRLTLSLMQQPCSVKPGFCMICNGLQPSKAECVGLIADDHKHRRQIIPFKFEAIADKRTTNPVRREENKERTYFKSDWRCYKGNNSVPPIGQRHAFPLKIVLVGSVVMVGKVKLDSTFPIIVTVCRRSPPTPGTEVSLCLQSGADV